MIVIGLTGSIATGKSTVARLFARYGIPWLDSDAVVHRALKKGGEAILEIEKHFPKTVKEGEVDRSALGKAVFGDNEKLDLLESILHPIVWKTQKSFLRRARIQRRKAALLDIPLLFETGAEKRCGITIVTVAPKFLQRRRALSRARMTEEKFKEILKRQMPDAQKKKRADYVIHTGLGLRHSLNLVARILAGLGGRGPDDPCG